MDTKNINCIVIFILLIIFFLLAYSKLNKNFIIIIGLLIILFNYNLITHTNFFNNSDIELFTMNEEQNKFKDFLEKNYNLFLNFKKKFNVEPFSPDIEVHKNVTFPASSTITTDANGNTGLPDFYDTLCPINVSPNIDLSKLFKDFK